MNRFYKQVKPWYVKMACLVGLSIIGNLSFAQTTLYSENFNSGSSTTWTLNTSDLGSDPANNNYWDINNTYNGGFFGGTTPNQPAAVTGFPQSVYMHIQNDLAGNASFLAPATGNVFTKLNTGISTLGATNVTLTFYYLCNGGNNNYRGRLYYSIDGGNSWIQQGANYGSISSWTLSTVTNPAWDNVADLRFAFMWAQLGGGGATAADPAFAVDEIKVVGTTTACSLSLTSSGTNPTCNGSTNGSITSSVTGATGTVTYTLNGGSSNTTGSWSNLGAGSYTVIAVEGSCRDTATVTLTQPAPVGTPTASSNTPVCEGQTLQLNAATVASATYSWSGPNGFTSSQQNPSIASVSLAAAGNYTVTATVGGCTATSTTTVVINPQPAAPTVSSNSPVCEGQTLNLTASTIAGGTYNWNGPNGFSSSLQNPSRGAITQADAGQYNVTVTVTGCSPVSGSVSVTVNPGPGAVTASNNGPYCVGDIIILSGSSVASGIISWTGPNGFNSSLQNPSFGAQANSGGDYIYTVTTASCGSTSDTTTVVVNNVPTGLAATSNSPLCVGQNLNLSIGSSPGATYDWTGPNNFTSSQQNPTRNAVTVADAGDYIVTLTNGCGSASDTVTVSITAGAPAVTASNNGPACSGQPLTLSATTINGATYSWTGPNNFTSSQQNPVIPSVSVSNAGTYTVVVSTGSCGTSTDTTIVSITASPSAPTLSSNSPLCPGDLLSLTSTTVPGATYAWSGPGSFSSNSQNPSRPSVSLADGGTYTVTATVAGCGSVTASIQVTVNTPPIANTSSNSPVCIGDTLRLNVNTSSGASYVWSGPNGFIALGASTFIANAAASDAGTYAVTVTVGSCTATSSITVGTNPLPRPKAGSDGNRCWDELDSLNANDGSGYVAYLWQPGGSTSPIILPSSSGQYIVTVTDTNGCKGSDTVNYVILPKPDTTTFIQLGDTLVSSWDTASEYQWFLNGDTISGATSQSLVITESGNYSVIVTDGNGCSSISEEIFATYVGLDEINLASGLSVYPNPSQGVIHISKQGIAENMEVTLYNAVGAIIYNGQVELGNGQIATINVNEVASGVYVLKIKTNSRSLSQKLIIE
ncbi:MAG: T9SS type A sorting domain-containing protein [Chitinophagales bacterium]|nr:T9SS type A sorting domain-containing protein [Chitinophagales bacterium]